MYKKIIKKILFKFTPEKAHNITFKLLKLPFVNFFLKILFSYQSQYLKFNKKNLKTSNPIGLAAGLDKEGELIKQFGNIGFGFVEIGTVTPKAQPGNPKPRLFRLIKDSALINRMGFNNNGAYEMKNNLKRIKNKKNTTIGINIGKNKNTSLEEAHNDYLKSFKILFNYADYFAINVSSPNTPNLRELQEKKYLEKIFSVIQIENNKYKYPKPLFIKIAPDLKFYQIDEIIDLINKYKLTGIIATNTTIERNNLLTNKKYIEQIGDGGLSGKPLKNKSTEIIKYINSKSKDIIIIGVGGIFSFNDVKEKIEAGADLIQIYTSFIYEGPALVKKIKKQLSEFYKNHKKY